MLFRAEQLPNLVRAAVIFTPAGTTPMRSDQNATRPGSYALARRRRAAISSSVGAGWDAR